MIFDVRVSDGIVPRKTPDEIQTADYYKPHNHEQHNPPLPAPVAWGLIWSVGHDRRLRLPRCRKFENEINQSLFAQINFAEINAWRDFPNLVTDPVRYQRSLGIIEHNALLAIHPAGPLVHFGDDCVQSER